MRTIQSLAAVSALASMLSTTTAWTLPPTNNVVSRQDALKTLGGAAALLVLSPTTVVAAETLPSGVTYEVIKSEIWNGPL